MSDFTPCLRTVEMCAKVAAEAGQTCWVDPTGETRTRVASEIEEAIRALQETSEGLAGELEAAMKQPLNPAYLTRFDDICRNNSNTILTALRDQGAMREALTECVDAMRDWIVPDGISGEDAMGRIVGALDNPKINPIILGLDRQLKEQGDG